MSRLISGRPGRRPPRTVVQRHTPRGDEAFLDKVDSWLQRGHVVVVSRFRSPFVSIVENGSHYLLRKDDDLPIGTFTTLTQAVAALDAHVEDGGTGDAA